LFILFLIFFLFWFSVIFKKVIYLCFFLLVFFSPFFSLKTVFGVFNFNYSFYFCLVCVETGKAFSCVLGNYSNKNPCHKRMGSLVKWWTTNKTDTNAHIGKNCFSKLLTLLGIWCVVHPPHVMTKLKKKINLVILIWINKVSYAKGLKDVWNNKN
jgi:hypothetical protein